MSFNFAEAIFSANEQITKETAVHEKRMEFWKGYICAMQEAKDHIEDQAR